MNRGDVVIVRFPFAEGRKGSARFDLQLDGIAFAANC